MRLLAENLALARGGRRLIDGLSLSVESGAALVLTGPNGVGKTTLLRALAGFIPPEAGSIRLQGAADERAIGEYAHYVGHANGLKPGLTVSENARFWRQFLGGERGADDAALEMLDVEHLAHVPAGYLSAGQKRRLGLVRLLLAKRPLWLLDEPMAALDMRSQALLSSLMLRHLDEGGMLVAATHGPLGLAGAEILELAAPPIQDTALADGEVPLEGL